MSRDRSDTEDAGILAERLVEQFSGRSKARQLFSSLDQL
jgi:hypothetical protein